jgi:hypothetical protein
MKPPRPTQRKFASKYKVSLFYFKKFNQIFFEIFSYFPFLPPPPTGLVSQIFFLSPPGNIKGKIFFFEYGFEYQF